MNPKAGFVYQTEALLTLNVRVQARCPRVNDETVQSTSMSKKYSLALVAGAVCFGASSMQAFAFDDDMPPPEPRVIYAQPLSTPPMPIRVAYNERSNSNMGGDRKSVV